MSRRAVLSGAAAIALIAAGMVAVSGPALAADTATINGATSYQTIAGFGASEGFGEADAVMNAPAAAQQQALDLLYSPSSGAGLTILRNEISADSGSTIEPTAPSSPTATPAYSALGNDQGQEWFAQQIKADFGVTNVFADAWSAPGFMKTNDSPIDGGTLCGAPVSIGNESYNASIPAGSSTQLGFQGTWTSSDATPTSFAVNGTACSL